MQKESPRNPPSTLIANTYSIYLCVKSNINPTLLNTKTKFPKNLIIYLPPYVVKDMKCVLGNGELLSSLLFREFNFISVLLVSYMLPYSFEIGVYFHVRLKIHPGTEGFFYSQKKQITDIEAAILLTIYRRKTMHKINEQFFPYLDNTRSA